MSSIRRGGPVAEIVVVDQVLVDGEADFGNMGVVGVASLGIEAGLLDELAEAALTEHRAGKSTVLPGDEK